MKKLTKEHVKVILLCIEYLNDDRVYPWYVHDRMMSSCETALDVMEDAGLVNLRMVSLPDGGTGHEFTLNKDINPENWVKAQPLLKEYSHTTQVHNVPEADCGTAYHSGTVTIEGNVVTYLHRTDV